MPDRGVQEDGERAEQGDRGDRVGDLAGRAAMTGAVADDRGVAADGRADRDEDGQPVSTLTRRATRRTMRERGRHRDDDRAHRRQADPGDLAEAEPGAEQDDPEAQDALASERDARLERHETRPGGRRDHDPEQQGDRDLGDDRRQERGEEPGDDGDGDRRREPGSDRSRATPDRGRAGQDGASLGWSTGGGAGSTISTAWCSS